MKWKWRGVPVWEHAGIICTGETYESVVKLAFAKSAALEPRALFIPAHRQPQENNPVLMQNSVDLA